MLLLIVGIPVALLFIIKLITKRFANPYKLCLVFGKKGSGKSTYLIKLALKYMKKKFTVYTNMEDCMIDGVRIFDTKHLGDYVPCENAVLLIDEAGMIWDNRDFKSFRPQVRDYFKYQRHYKTIIFLASQTFDVDKKIRDLTDNMILFTCILNVFSLGRPIRKKITLTESTSEAESRIAENLKFKGLFSWKITYIPKYSKYFDSFNLPEKPELPYKQHDKA